MKPILNVYIRKRDKLVHFHFRKTEIFMSTAILIWSCTYG